MDISPFFITDEYGYSLCLDTGEGFCREIFAAREHEGFEGSGYDWDALVAQYLNECMPYLIQYVIFDSEAGMFCAMSEDREVLEDLAKGLIELSQDKDRMADIFSRAEHI
ncbi:MAG: hypothetical protein J6I96_03430 [Oscillospiraceae bacterium]|nr:hypothetical protein [Oscillospiraceae bacterium]